MFGVEEYGIYKFILENRFCCIFFDWGVGKVKSINWVKLKLGVSRKRLLGDSNLDLFVNIG